MATRSQPTSRCAPAQRRVQWVPHVSGRAHRIAKPLRAVLVWLLSAPLMVAAVSAQTDRFGFRRHVLNPASRFASAAAIDVNEDGLLDIVCGEFWYEAPGWSPHRFREIEQIRGRYDDYSNLPLDVDGDGDLDIVSVNYRSQSLYWSKNPGPKAKDAIWERVVIDRPGPSETGRLIDIDGDGRLDVLPNGTRFAAWYEAVPDRNSEHGVRWLKHPLPQELSGHGIGAGDVNGDGHIDIISPHGWAEAPGDPRRQNWTWHPDFKLARDCGILIICTDVDGDGDSDLVWGRGHNIGLYWSEQLGADEPSITFASTVQWPDGSETYIRDALDSGKWAHHAIDTRWSNAHTLLLADIDGDGRNDLVTGKRYLGHGGRDPGENDPLSVWWYQFDSARGAWVDHLVSYGGTCGIDVHTECVDLDGDGDLDIIAPAESGLHLLENLRVDRGAQQAASPIAQNVAPDVAARDPFDLTYWVDSQGDRHPLSDWLQHGFKRQQVLRQMEQVMGPLPGSHRRVRLDPRVVEVADAGRYWRVKLTYQAEPGDRVPAYLLLPKQLDAPAPAMLCLHPTHFQLGKAQICGLGGNPTRFYAHELAEQGFVCLAPDYPGFAEYQYDFESDDYASGTMKAIWNNIRAVDLLESLPIVDRDRIGVIGHSLGGHNALFTAAFDQRLRVVVTSCGFNAFPDYYDGDLTGWTSERYMPRIASQYGKDPARMPFDFPEVLLAIAPRPVFVNAPLHDSNFAVAGVKKCERALAEMYHALGSANPTTFVYPDAGHDFPDAIRQQVYQWLHDKLR